MDEVEWTFLGDKKKIKANNWQARPYARLPFSPRLSGGLCKDKGA